MSEKLIRVLVTDDSATVRTWLTTVLTPEFGFQIVGEARDGAQSIELAARLKPDIIVMDVEMPNTDGFHATEAIMRQTPTPILIFTSTAVYRSKRVPFKSLSAGALDVMLKPKSVFEGRQQTIADMLRKKLRVLSNVVVIRKMGASTNAGVGSLSSVLTSVPRIVAIGASTGGPTAIAKLLSEMPPSVPYGVVLVQHMAHEFISGFVEWLGESCQVPVQEAKRHETLEPGRVYVAPGTHHLVLDGDLKFGLLDTPPVHECRPSADVLFQSIAKNHPRTSLGIVLTGMGRDGAEGLLRLKQAGGQTMAQDEASCVIFGMPKEALALGAVDQLLTLSTMAHALKNPLKAAA